MKLLFISVIIILVLWGKFPLASCSIGDRSSIYLNCLHRCVKENCTNDGENFKSKAAQKQDLSCKLLRWSCDEECRYQCMWFTVQKFQAAGEGTPKFHGRWPFIRVMGIQEPAAAFASMLNLAANAFMYRKIRRQFPMSKIHAMPIVALWHGYLMVCMNAWVWSTIFHMRDNAFTEFMDYACALSMVMGLFVAGIIRVCYKRTKLMVVLLLIPLSYFVSHVRYLYGGVVDYDYNMTLNVLFGAIGVVVWLCLSWTQYCRGRAYAPRMLYFLTLSMAAVVLELLDFPPRLGWDAHALWHLTTSPLPLLFYRYVLDDLHFLQTQELESFAYKLT
ncbi:unnamed protein product [Chrysodeixis includens]|uniref:Post-GPI attachment to proteins factor 3 n=1 Tax=Chrysodeixis includens TaxID=689277 RepID=A0A9P0C3I8_CHRIL|nr:unnamed protein product [Chrysodeixis includens]